MNEQLSRDTANLRGVLMSLVDEFPKAVEEGRRVEWATAMHSVIDMYEGKRYDINVSSPKEQS